MKRAPVRQRRTLADGRRLLCVACPVCDGRHWLPVAEFGTCPRKPGRAPFAIAGKVGR